MNDGLALAVAAKLSKAFKLTVMSTEK